MHRLLAGACLLALVAVVARADDSKGQKPSAIWGELLQKYRAAKSNEDRNQVLEDYSKKFIAYGKDNAKTEQGAEALGYLFQLPPLPALKGSRDEALALLKKDYVKSKTIKSVLTNLARAGDDGEKVVKSVYEDNPDKATRAFAAKALIKAREQSMKMAQQLKANPAFRANYERAKGKEATQKLIDSIEEGEKAIKGYRAALKGDLKGFVADLSIGEVAPEIISQDLKGNKVKLSDLRGKVVVLDIWATWCPPCRAMIPHSRELVAKLKDKPFVLVGISADAKKETLTEFMKKNEMPWTHWWNGATGGIVKDWDVEYYPTIYVLDAKGVIRYKDVRDVAMDKAVETLLKEMDDKTKGKGN